MEISPLMHMEKPFWVFIIRFHYFNTFTFKIYSSTTIISSNKYTLNICIQGTTIHPNITEGNHCLNVCLRNSKYFFYVLSLSNAQNCHCLAVHADVPTDVDMEAHCGEQCEALTMTTNLRPCRASWTLGLHHPLQDKLVCWIYCFVTKIY